MIEVDGDLFIIERLDHAGQLGISRIVENHQQARGKVHVLELAARDDLHVLRVGLAKGVFRQDLQVALVPGLETEQCRLEPRQQVAIADLECRRRLVEGAVDGVAILQVQGEMQGDFRVLANTCFGHQLISHERLLRSSYS
ncbi:hypothetical protein D9M71_470570 [compost metagenome]